MKCPFCQQELVEIQFGEQRYWSCTNDRCNESVGLGGNLKLWQELIRTRKALDVCKSKLNGIHRLYSHAFYHRDDWLAVCMEMVDKANTALDQIKQITESRPENVQPDTKSRPVNVQKKMTPEEFSELELLVNATFK